MKLKESAKSRSLEEEDDDDETAEKVEEPEQPEKAEKPKKAEEAEETEDSEPATAESDNVGDASVEINVEELIHDLEADGLAKPAKEQAAKRRLEELIEKKRSKRDLEDFDDYEV